MKPQESPITTQTELEKGPICKLYQLGNCASGKNCAFKHMGNVTGKNEGKNLQGLEISRLASQLQAITEALKKAGLM